MNENLGTIIYLLKGCPLDNNYEHTIYFETWSEQQRYFSGLENKFLTGHTYQRVASNKIRVQINADELIGYNYLMFKNPRQGNKWYYCFITEPAAYINEVTSEITYEVDVMQTWAFDYNLRECFVEREHPEHDTMGGNLVPENLECGEFKLYPVNAPDPSRPVVTPFKSFKIGILASIDKEYNQAEGGNYASMYSGLRVLTFDTAQEANNFIKWATSKNLAESIVGVYMIPSIFEPGTPTQGKPGGAHLGVNQHIKKKLDTLDGYKPRNNKLFTMPYNGIMVTNNAGKVVQYGYEYFYPYPSVVPNDNIVLAVASSGVNCPEYVLYPWFYKGLDYNYNERITLTDTPQCGFNVDTFRAWLAQHQFAISSDTLVNVGKIVGGLASSNPIGAGVALSGVHGIYNQVKNVQEHSLLAPTAVGNTGGGAVNINSGHFGFDIYYYTITAEFAKIIDDYFTMYGYQTNRVKVPNTHVRPNWTYTKTVNCLIVGDVPADAASKICNNFNNGITFWKNGNNIGDYSLPN